MAGKTFKRVVKGPKPIHHVDPKTGERFIAQPGDTIDVTPQTAVSKAAFLVDPKVAAAQKKAEEAAAEAANEAVSDEEDDSKES